jgi:hypothetical protein
MIQTTYVWKLSLHLIGQPIKGILERAYGSKNSGTIYIVADNIGEAQAVARELFNRNGFVPPETIHVIQTHLVKQALRMSY